VRCGSGWHVVGLSSQQSASQQLAEVVHDTRSCGLGVRTWLLACALGEDLGRTPCIGMAGDTLPGPFDFAPMTDYRNTSWRRSAQGDRLENPRQQITQKSLLKMSMVSGSGFVKMYYFPRWHRPKILLTAVFISPIIRAERPRAASAGKLETPGKASNPAVCGPS
jgi:hypothetical protein